MKLKSNIALSDSGFLLNPSTGESFSLNPMGVSMLKMLNEGKEYAEIENIMLSEYDTTKSNLDKDFQDFIGVLNQLNLLETEESEK